MTQSKTDIQPGYVVSVTNAAYLWRDYDKWLGIVKALNIGETGLVIAVVNKRGLSILDFDALVVFHDGSVGWTWVGHLRRENVSVDVKRALNG